MRLNEVGRAKLSKAVLVTAILFNLGVLGYFKYANFFVDVTNDVFGSDFILTQIILPLGISFITFQKIAFLIDAHARRVDSLTFQEYSLFILFFPQLIAGPIVHYREMMPQYRQLSCTFDRTSVSVGLTLFFIGLFKKVFLADGLAPAVSSIYLEASSGVPLSLFPAWMAAVGFTLQIYFDFSGYTDMALGAAKIFGLRLPPNFDSPLRASSIIEFWSRWHMTLTRFLTAYVYNPLLLWLTRRRLASGRPPGRHMTVGAFLELVAFPTLLTMFISGMWHGAGYLFILWGVVHGIFLTVNHVWRQFGPNSKSGLSNSRAAHAAAFALTILCIVASMVIFRAPTMLAATTVFKGMLGFHGVALPESVYTHLGPLAPWLQHIGVSVGLELDLPFLRTSIWIVLLSMIAFTCPNSLQLLRAYEPAFGWKGEHARVVPSWLQWQPSLAWTAAVSVVVVVAALHLGGESEFLYWQF
jgi:D-alanyl-lipoteichoic acid acyltransferase DltB (MBOAT superfamily)